MGTETGMGLSGAFRTGEQTSGPVRCRFRNQTSESTLALGAITVASVSLR